MSTMNPLDPYGGTTPPIEQLIGNAYDNVRKVASNIPIIKEAADNIENIKKASELSDRIDSIVEDVEANQESARASKEAAAISAQEAKNYRDSSEQHDISANTAAVTATSLIGAVNKAILSYGTLVEAANAAETLPDDQEVSVQETKSLYKVQAGELVYVSDLPSSFNPGFLDTQKFPTILKLRESWNVADFLTGSRTDHTAALQKALTHAAEERFSVGIGNKIWDIEAGVTASGPLSIKGNGSRISGLRFRQPTAGLTQLIQTEQDGTTVEGVAFITDAPHNVGRYALRIDGRAMLSGGTIAAREQMRGSLSDIRCFGSSQSSAGWGEGIDLVSTGWLDVEKINIIAQARQGTSDFAGRGVLVRGEGIPVEINMRSLWMYNVGVGVQAPDYSEGISISQFNFLNVSRGIEMGIQDASYSLRASGFASLASVIVGGHINASTSGVVIAGVNQANVSSVVIYLDGRGISSLSGTSRGIRLSVGSHNRVSKVQVHNYDNTSIPRNSFELVSVTKSSLSEISSVKTASGSPFARGVEFSGTAEDNYIDGLVVDGATVGIHNGVTSARNTISNFRLFNCTTPITDTQATEQNKLQLRNSYVAPTRLVTYNGSTVLTIEVQLPADTFYSRPNSAVGTIDSIGGTDKLVCRYNYQDSSSTKVVFTISTIDGTAMPASGQFRFGAVINS